MMSGLSPAALTGKLRVEAGSPRPLSGVRPAASGALLRRMLRGRSAERVPALLSALYTLCGELHRLTAARAIASARGRMPDPDALRREELYLRAACLREHMLQVGLSWPTHAPSARGAADTTWLRGLPELAAADTLQPASSAAVSDSWSALASFAEQRLIGSSAHTWLRTFGDAAVGEWAAAHSSEQPVAAWLHEQAPRARRLRLALRPWRIPDAPAPALQLLAADMHTHLELAQHAGWRGRPVDTGAFSRAAGPAHTAYDLLTARVTELVRLCRSAPWLRLGALTLGQGEGIGFTELARGLLVHWVKLAGSQVEDYRILTPTDFCLHPQGALTTRLAAPGLERADVQLLLTAFDPCVEVELIDVALQHEGRGHA